MKTAIRHSANNTTLGNIDCPVLVTDRLVLRPPVADDISDLVRLANNRDVARMTSRMPYPYTVADAQEFLALANGGATDECIYACTLAANGEYIGGAGLTDLGYGPEIGYWLGEPHWACGYATEIAHALVDLAFRATDIDMLVAGCRKVNRASRRVLEKNGFRYTHDTTGPSLVDGQVPMFRFRLTRGEWIALRSAKT